MGGNAIKDVRRIDKTEFHSLEQELKEKLSSLLETRVDGVVSYEDKDFHSDIDLLVQRDSTKTDFIEKIKDFYNLGEADSFKNGSTYFSFRHPSNVQVDLIFVSSENFDISQKYLSYNDMSNLLGRMSKKLGFKISSRGLFYYEIYKGKPLEVLFSKDYDDALELLELDVQRYYKGFKTLDDVFDFVISSPYFNKEIYVPSNRNSKNRNRDFTRKNYMLFLEYIQNIEDAYNYNDVTDFGGYGSINNIDLKFKEKMFNQFPIIECKLFKLKSDVAYDVQFKKYFNGKIVKKLAEEIADREISGPELGNIMQVLKPFVSKRKHKIVFKKEFKMNNQDFHIIKMSLGLFK